MKPLPGAITAAIMLCLAGTPAEAAILWQQTFTADPSGQTVVSDAFMPLSVPIELTTTHAYLQVKGGTFADVGWTDNPLGTIFFWQQFPPPDGPWQLWFDSTPGGPIVSSDVTGPTISAHTVTSTAFDECYGAMFHVPGVCADYLGYLVPGGQVVGGYGDITLAGATINATQDFTLVLSSGEPAAIPEPSTWALMLTGFGLLGLVLRRRRGHAPSTTGQDRSMRLRAPSAWRGVAAQPRYARLSLRMPPSQRS
jgi:hypothetical protein